MISRARTEERGQTLVEYALIIAIVGLGSILALGFLSGKINTLFSEAGNSLNSVEAAEVTPGGGGSAPATPSITSGPAEGSSGNSAGFTSPSFAFTGDGSQTGFECRLDGGVFAACTSPRNYSGLVPGGHSFQVQASNGNGTSSPSTRSWTVTANPPTAGTVAISCPGNRCDDGDTLTGVLSGWLNATSYTYLWEQHSSSSQTCGSSGGWSTVGGNSPTVSGISVNGQTDALRLTVIGHGSGPDTAPVCTSVVVYTTDTEPPSGSVTISCGGGCNDGETATATGSWSGVPAPTLTYQWAWNESSSASCTSTSGWNTLGTGSTQVLGTSGNFDSDAIRVIVTATNGDPGGPVTDRDCTTYS